MILFNLLGLSVRNFKNMKLRSMLTVLGIGIGIGAILFLVSLGQGLQRLLIARITTAESLLTLDVVPPSQGLITLDAEMISEIKNMKYVTEVSPVKVTKVRVGFGSITAGVTANFVENSFFRLAGITKSLKQEKNDVDAPQLKDSIFTSSHDIVVSKTVLDLLSLKNEALGSEVNVKVIGGDGVLILDQNFRVTGIVEDMLASVVYLPVESYPEDKLTNYNNLKLQVKSTVFLESVREMILTKGFIVSALSDTVRQANRVFSIMQVILGIFGAIALLVAAIGMFNTMTIALLERTNEIGIMRAIGASKRDIWLLFLSEAAIIGFLGGVSGIFIGVGGAEVANLGLNFLARRLGGEPLTIFYHPLWFVFLIVGFSTLVALITGFYPAKRASSLNPLAALRYK